MNNMFVKQLLLCPGPVNLADSVKISVVTHEIGHRELEFSLLLNDINDKLLTVAGATPKKKYQAVVITGSGSAANESVLSSLGDNKKILILSNGEFGERLFQISSFYNPDTEHISFGWAKGMDLKVIEKFLDKQKVDVVMMVHHETSTGMLNPIEKIGALVKKHKALFVVDTVSSFGAEKINIEKSHIDFCTSSASKALGSLPGASFVIGKKSEFNKLKKNKAKTIYLDLYRFYHYAADLSQTPNTPAVQTFFALDQALKNLLCEGLDNRIKSIRYLSSLMRAGLKKQNLKFLIDEKVMSSVLTTIMVPDYITVSELRNKLKLHNIIVYGGKGPFVDSVFQVATIGEISHEDIKYFLQTLAQILQEAKEAQALKLGKIKVSKTHLLPNLFPRKNPSLYTQKH